MLQYNCILLLRINNRMSLSCKFCEKYTGRMPFLLVHLINHCSKMPVSKMFTFQLVNCQLYNLVASTSTRKLCKWYIQSEWNVFSWYFRFSFQFAKLFKWFTTNFKQILYEKNTCILQQFTKENCFSTLLLKFYNESNFERSFQSYHSLNVIIYLL